MRWPEWLALVPTAAGDPVSDPSTYAGLGVVATALVIGATLAYRYIGVPERARADRLEAQVTTLNGVIQKMQEQTVGALVAGTASANEAQNLAKGLVLETERLRRHIVALESRPRAPRPGR